VNCAKGFTLLEVMLTGLIAAVLAGSILPMLYMGNEQIRDIIVYSRMSQQQQIISESIRRAAREAYIVMGDGVAPPGAALPNGQSGFERLTFYTRLPDGISYQIIGGIRSRAPGNWLEEWDGTWKTLRIGNDSISLVNPRDFAISPYRRAASYDIDITQTAHGKTYVLNSPREYVLCHNKTD
jgi:hypothetical protein